MQLLLDRSRGGGIQQAGRKDERQKQRQGSEQAHQHTSFHTEPKISHRKQEAPKTLEAKEALITHLVGPQLDAKRGNLHPIGWLHQGEHAQAKQAKHLHKDQH